MYVQNRFTELLAVKSRRENRKITREAVAKETGISITSVQNWASNNVTRFDALQIATFCRYFRCDIADLLVLPEKDIDPEINTPLLARA